MDEEKLYALIESLVNERTGINIQVLGDGYLVRCIQSRLKKDEYASLYDFYERLKNDRDVWNEFVEEISVSETWFFRDPQAFVALRSYVQKHSKAFNKQKPLRILSLPCSTGEEPYSIAMTLVQMGMSSEHWVIHAVDINNSSLAKAKKGSYGTGSFRNGDKNIQQQFFVHDDDRLVIHSELAKNIIFSKKNIFDLQELNLQPFDIIFCRNLFIYFTQERVQRGLELLESILVRDGLLFVGHAETIHIPLDKFTPSDTSLSFAYQYTFSDPDEKPLEPLPTATTNFTPNLTTNLTTKLTPKLATKVAKKGEKKVKKTKKAARRGSPKQPLETSSALESKENRQTESDGTESQAESVVLNDCWNKIGSWSRQPFCEKLREHYHCRNCNYYASEARNVLKKVVSPQLKSEWAKVYAEKVEIRESGTNVATLFRVSDRWLTVSTKAVNEVITWRLIRSIPRKHNPALLGIVNVHGELRLCVSLAKMLNLKEQKRNPQFIIVFNNGENQVACPVDEVRGNIRYHSEQLHDIPGHWNEQSRSLSQGFLKMEDKEIIRLEEQNIFAAVWGNEA